MYQHQHDNQYKEEVSDMVKNRKRQEKTLTERQTITQQHDPNSSMLTWSLLG